MRRSPLPRRLPAVPKVRKCERDRVFYLDFSSVAAPYRQVVGRGDFVERHACRCFASGPSDRNRLVGCTFVDFLACSSGSASQLVSSRMEEEFVLAVVALSYMQAYECAGRLRHVRRLRRVRLQPNGRCPEHE